jgi:hypothetical protein
METIAQPTVSFKRELLLFRIVNTLIIIGLIGGGLSQLIGIDFQVDQFTRLGYPMILMKMIGSAKLLAAIVLIVPGIPLLKIAAYVGTFIVAISAFIAHLAAGEFQQLLNPFVLMGLVLFACLRNPYIKVVALKP